MSSILLTSNGFSTNEIIAQFKALIPKIHTTKAVIITTSSAQQKGIDAIAIKAQQELVKMGVSQVDFFDMDNEPNINLKQYNIIFISGDNPFILLTKMSESGLDYILKSMAVNDNITIVGASAGTAILGEHIEHINFIDPQSNNVNLIDFKALAISKATIFPHYDREDMFLNDEGNSIEQRLSFYEHDSKKTITRLKEKDYVIDLHLKSW